MSPRLNTHTEPTLTTEQQAELAALEAALRGDAIADEALSTLVREVRAAAPVMAPDAGQELNERVAAGFPRRGVRRLGALRLPLSGPAPVAASVLIALAVVGGGIQLLRSQTSFEAQSGTASTAIAEPAAGDVAVSSEPMLDADQPVPGASQISPQSAGAPEAAGKVVEQVARANADGTAAAAPAAPSGAKGLADDRFQSRFDDPNAFASARAVQRSTQLQVRVKSGGLPDAAREVGRIARRGSGYVVTSELSLERRGAGTASYVLRVDAGQLDRVIDQLSDLGTVTGQNQQTLDVTNSLNSARGRLADANAARRALLKALERATTATQVNELKAKIAENRRLRSRLTDEVQSIRVRVNRTEVYLTLTAPRSDAPSLDDGRWSLGDAAADAGKALTTILGAMLIGAAAALPFALVVGAAWLLARGRRRRGRERALDE